MFSTGLWISLDKHRIILIKTGFWQTLPVGDKPVEKLLSIYWESRKKIVLFSLGFAEFGSRFQVGKEVLRAEKQRCKMR